MPRSPDKIGYAEIGDRTNLFLKSFENMRGCSTRSRMEAAERSEGVLRRNRQRRRDASSVRLSLEEDFIPMDEQESGVDSAEPPREERRKPASWGKSLVEKEQEESDGKGRISKADRRRNVPEDRMKFLQQEHDRKRWRWGDPVDCSGFETCCTKKLKMSLMELTVGQFLQVQEVISVEDKCKIAFLDKDFERLMGVGTSEEFVGGAMAHCRGYR